LLSKPFEGNKTRVCPNDKQANGKLQTKSPEDGPPAHLHSIQIMFLLTTTKKEKGTKTHLKKKQYIQLWIIKTIVYTTVGNYYCQEMIASTI